MNLARRLKQSPPLDPAKFKNPHRTATGEPRADVALTRLDTLWFNTGTLCNLTCGHCYIESSPSNDRLIYLSAVEVARFLDELERDWRAGEIGFTGGEPFMNKDIVAMLDDALSRGYRCLVLTNAMKPMRHRREELLALKDRYGDRLALRISIDHYLKSGHELERGDGSWEITLNGLQWLARNGFPISVAGRTMWNENEAQIRAGFAELFAAQAIKLDADDPAALVLFPEMDAAADVPEITTACWDILGKRPDDVMCSNSRMVVHRRGDPHAAVVACTLLPYDGQFELGKTLREASGAVKLNHPHCAKFCVLGGASCSVEK